MHEMGLALAAGVISGLITAALLLTFGQYWRSVLRPAIQSFLYKGVRIDGVWTTEVTVKGQKKIQTAVLQQKAYAITGTLTYPEDTQGRSHTYRIEGFFVDNILTMLAREMGHGRADRGAILLLLQPGLSKISMKGFGIWLAGHEPVTLEYMWHRELL